MDAQNHLTPFVLTEQNAFNRMYKPKPPQTLQEWMVATGTNQTALRRLVLTHAGIAISKGQMSDILSGSQRCSLERALVLCEISGVPVEKLVEWPTARTKRIMSAPVQIEETR